MPVGIGRGSPPILDGLGGRGAKMSDGKRASPPRAGVRLLDDADKLFNWVGIERRFCQHRDRRLHQPASSLVNGSFRSCDGCATIRTTHPSERFVSLCRPTALTHSPLACATLSAGPRRRRRYCSPLETRPMRPIQGSGACLEVRLRYSLIGLRSSAGPRPRLSFARVFKHFGHRAISPDLAFARVSISIMVR